MSARVRSTCSAVGYGEADSRLMRQVRGGGLGRKVGGLGNQASMGQATRVARTAARLALQKAQ